VQLGSRTDTGDREGVVVEERAVPALDESRVEQVLAGFRGVQSQVPPMYSALKRAGRPLYELARLGLEVERNARTIDIRRLEPVQQRADSLDLVCECAKGTYIRVLGEDISKALGTVGHLTSLRRLWVEPFRGVPMLTLDAALAGAPDRGGLLQPDAALQALPYVGLSAPMAAAMRQGQAVTHAEAARSTGRRVRIYGPDGEFMGLAEALADGRLQPRRLMRIESP
jgi:tRNA pseudouridine55 synthase